LLQSAASLLATTQNDLATGNKVLANQSQQSGLQLLR
jgi:hypothetical protein